MIAQSVELSEEKVEPGLRREYSKLNFVRSKVVTRYRHEAMGLKRSESKTQILFTTIA